MTAPRRAWVVSRASTTSWIIQAKKRQLFVKTVTAPSSWPAVAPRKRPIDATTPGGCTQPMKKQQYLRTTYPQCACLFNAEFGSEGWEGDPGTCESVLDATGAAPAGLLSCDGRGRAPTNGAQHAPLSAGAGTLPFSHIAHKYPQTRYRMLDHQPPPIKTGPQDRQGWPNAQCPRGREPGRA